MCSFAAAEGALGNSDGALASTRSFSIDGTSRPVGVAVFATAGGDGSVVAADAGGVTACAGGGAVTACAGGGAVTACAGGGAVTACTGGGAVSTGTGGGAVTDAVGGCTGTTGGGDMTAGTGGGTVTTGTGGGAVMAGSATAAGAGGATSAGAGAGWTAAATGAISDSSGGSSTIAGGAIFGALTRRGGPSRGRAAGSGVFAPLRPRPADRDFAENKGPAGRLRLRSRAVRSANCLATISSIVLEALLASMPCSRLSRSMTS